MPRMAATSTQGYDINFNRQELTGLTTQPGMSFQRAIGPGILTLNLAKID